MPPPSVWWQLTQVAAACSPAFTSPSSAWTPEAAPSATARVNGLRSFFIALPSSMEMYLGQVRPPPGRKDDETTAPNCRTPIQPAFTRHPAQGRKPGRLLIRIRPPGAGQGIMPPIPLFHVVTMLVLLVEDDPLIASGILAGLAAQGLTVEHAATAAGAEALLGTASFDVLILDLGLPDEDGLALLQRLRRQGLETPVLVLSARDTVGERVAGLQAGADDYL